MGINRIIIGNKRKYERKKRVHTCSPIYSFGKLENKYALEHGALFKQFFVTKYRVRSKNSRP